MIHDAACVLDFFERGRGERETERERERERKKERNISLLFHLFMHSLVDSCMCHDQGIQPATLADEDDALTY